MVKSVLRALTFTYLSLLATNYLLGAFSFISSSQSLVVIALSLLNLFARPLFTAVGLPKKGLGFHFLHFVLVLIMFYVLTSFIPYFYVSATTISGITLFGINLPSRVLSSFWSLVISSGIFVVVFGFFDYLCNTSKK